VKKSPPKAPERVQKRYQVALPVRITYWDKDKKPVLEMACTYDISPRGARITSVKAIKQTGEIVVLERGESKAFCRVVWVGDSASALKDQIGLETIEANQTMWPAELKAMQDVFDSLTWEEPEKIKEKGADKRRQHGSKGALVFRDPSEDDRVWVIFDWDEQGWQSFVSDPTVPPIMRDAGHKGKPQAAAFATRCHA